MDKITINRLQEMKGREKIAMITAYDALTAKIFDKNVDMILVGDSLNMSFGGHGETIGISVDEMIYHARAVRRGMQRAYLVVDMPFGSCATKKMALKNCIKVYEKTGCDAVKIEGGKEIAKTVRALVDAGICVVAHVGLRPQNSRAEGGYKVKGRDESAAKSILEDALALEDAGASFVVLEGVISEVAADITKKLSVPTIGIGAGTGTDGQVLVWSDAFGFFREFEPKFVKRYMEGADLLENAVKSYASEVKSGAFPSEEFEYAR